MGGVYSKMMDTIGDDAWKEWPWRHWTPVGEQYKKMPSFAVIEWTYRFCAWSCLVHAWKTGGLPVWFSSFLCGTANDCWFMHLPLCNNFWQAQASVMLTPRLPLYIVEMYATIVYISSVAARQFNLPYVSEATLTGLFAHVLYGVYDINGPPNLWWTWHDGDPAISKRQQNAPIGSSMWILTYISLHQLLLRFTEYPRQDTQVVRLLTDALEKILARLPASFKNLAERLNVKHHLHKIEALQRLLNKAPWAGRIGWAGLVCTPLFMALMGVFQIVSLDTLGIPGQRTYKLTLASFIAITLAGFKRANDTGALQLPKLKATASANKKLLAVVAAFYAVNVAINFKSDSTKHVSTGCHQKYGDSEKAIDIMFYEREDNLNDKGACEHSKDDYAFIKKRDHGRIDPSGKAKIIYPQKEGFTSEWYTVRGKPRKDWEGDSRLLLKMTAIGMIGYTAAFTNVFSRPSYI